MKRKLTAFAGFAASIAAAACAFAHVAPWITALFALAAGVDCLTLGLFLGGRDD